MMKEKLALSIILTLSTGILSGCAAMEQEMIGGQRDRHGCLDTAGYTWSRLRQQCIRVWEQGISVEDPVKPDEWAGSYAVFSKDGEKVELYLADSPDDHPILEKQDGVFWNHDFRLEKHQGTWHLIRRNTIRQQ